MGTAYRSCKLSNLGSPTTAIQLRKCGARTSIPKLLRRRGATLLSGKITPQLEEILLHHFPDVASPAMQDGASRIKRRPDRRLYLHEWRHDELHRVDVHVQKCWPWLRQPVLHSSFELVRARNRLAPETQRARDPCKVRILQLREGIEHSLSLLLDPHKPKLAVVIDGNLDRQLLLHDRHQVSEQHRNSTVARHANDLSAGFCLLESDRRRHAVGHRSMKQTGENAALTVHLDMAI